MKYNKIIYPISIIFSVIFITLIYFLYKKQTKHHKCLTMFETKEMLHLYDKNHIAYNIIDGYAILMKPGVIEDKTIKLCDINNSQSIKIARNKLLTQNRLQKHNINVSKFIEWKNNKSYKYNIMNINNKLTYPLVIKYSKGTLGNDVYTNIYSNKSLLNVVKKLQKENKNEIIIEEQQPGYRYRIYILNNNIIFIQKFYPPVIIGDGKSSVSELIDNYTKNTHNPMKYELQPVSHIEPHLIKKQGYKMDSILESNKKIYITGIITYSNGAIMENIPISSVHFTNIQMLLQINKIMGLNLSGIDFISEDIRTPYIGKVLEVNAAPSYDPGHQTDKTNKKLLNSMF